MAKKKPKKQPKKIVKNANRNKNSKKKVKKVSRKQSVKSTRKTKGNSKQRKTTRKPLVKNKTVSRVSKTKQVRKGVKPVKQTKQTSRKASKKATKKTSGKVLKKISAIKSEKRDALIIPLAESTFQNKVKQILAWSGNELKSYLRKKPVKAFFKLKIKPPKDYKDKFKDGFKWDIVPTPSGFNFTKDNIKNTLTGIIAAYNNEVLDFLDELEYDDPVKVWNLVQISIEFIY